MCEYLLNHVLTPLKFDKISFWGVKSVKKKKKCKNCNIKVNNNNNGDNNNSYYYSFKNSEKKLLALTKKDYTSSLFY